MSRLRIVLLFTSVFWLGGCLSATKPSKEPIRALTPIYMEDYVGGIIKSLEYSDNGQTLVSAGGCCVMLYNASNNERRAALVGKEYLDRLNNAYQPDEHLSAWVKGAGHIDDNTWYFAVSNPGENLFVHIRQIEPARELFRHDLGKISYEAVKSSKYYLLNGGPLYPRNDEPGCDCETQTDAIERRLTAGSEAIPPPYRGKDIWVRDLYTGAGLLVEIGSRVLETTISADAKYVISVSQRLKCEVWKLPEGPILAWPLPEVKKLGDCGRAGLLSTNNTFSADSRSFRVGTEHEMREYELPSLKLLRTLPIKTKMPGGRIVGSAMTADWFAAVDEKSNLRIWSLADGSLRGEYANEAMAEYRIGANSTHLAFQPGGTRLAVAQSSWLLVFDLAELAQPVEAAPSDSPAPAKG